MTAMGSNKTAGSFNSKSVDIIHAMRHINLLRLDDTDTMMGFVDTEISIQLKGSLQAYVSECEDNARIQDLRRRHPPPRRVL